MKGIIFDLDGVIIHTDHYHYLAWKKMCDQFHLSFNEQINHKLRGVSRLDSLEIILEHNDTTFSDEQKTLMTDIKNDYYKEFLSTLSKNDLDKNIKDTLYQLKKLGYKLSIGSSSRNAKLILKNIELLDFFEVISDGTNIKASKPDPEVFLKAAKWMGLNPNECAVVEDAVAGILAAKAGGMVAVGIGDAKSSSLADYKIDEAKDLLKIFR
jgi:beta-phosphoglucomutase